MVRLLVIFFFVVLVRGLVSEFWSRLQVWDFDSGGH